MTDIRLTFEELERLARSDAWVQGLARRLVGDADLAEDVVQEAYLVALSSEARPRGSFGAWLSGVIRNVASSRLRDEGRRREREERGAKREAVSSTAEHVARLEQQDLLIRALLESDEPYREALILRHVEGLAPRRIAARLDVPVATVNSRLARGLERLRERLDASHGGDRQRWMAGFAPLLIPTSKASPFLPGGLLVKYKLTTAAVAATLALILGNLALGDGPDAPTEQPLDVRTASAELPEEPGADAGPVEPGERRRSSVASTTGEPASLVATVGEPDPTITVELRAADSLQPLRGAELFVAELADFAMPEEALLELRNRMPWASRDLIRERGRRYVADDAGRVTVALPDRQVLVLAEAGELRLSKDLSARDDGEVLWLGPDRPLSARVRAANGLPVGGIPVQVAVRIDQGGGTAVTVPLASDLSSDGSGLAELVLPQEGREYGRQHDLVVTLGLPFDPPVFELLDLEQLGDEPIELVLPAAGQVEVHVRSAGQPVADGTLVRVGRTSPRGFQSALLGDAVVTARVIDGVARLGPLGLGTDFVVGATAPGLTSLECVEFEGPQLAGQVVAVTLELERRRHALVGSLHSEDGSVPDGSLTSLEFGYLYASGLELDAEGRFALDLDLHPDDRELTLHMYEPMGQRSLVVALPAERGDTIDLGALVLPAPEPGLVGGPAGVDGPVVEGVVFDAAGAPVASALLRWVSRDDSSSVWVPAGGAMAVTSSDGRFRLVGELPEPGAFLEVRSEAGWLDPLPLVVPSSDVVLRLGAPASLVGELRLDPEISSRGLSLGIWDERQGGAPERMDVFGWSGIALQGTSFRFEGLRPGSYTLRVEPNGDRAAATVLAGITVAGPDSSDPRLRPLDLGGSLSSFRLRVQDEAGKQLSAALYAFRGRGPEYLGHTDRAPFVLGQALPAAYVVEAEGYFPVSLDPAELPTVVTLTRGLPVAIEWVGAMELDELPFQLEVELVAVDGEGFELEAGAERQGAPEVHGGSRVAYYLEAWSPNKTLLGGGARPHVRAAGDFELRIASHLEDPPGVIHGRRIELPTPIFTTIDGYGPPLQLTLDPATIARESAYLP